MFKELLTPHGAAVVITGVALMLYYSNDIAKQQVRVFAAADYRDSTNNYGAVAEHIPEMNNTPGYTSVPHSNRHPIKGKRNL